MITKELFNGLFPTKGLTSPAALRKYNLVRERDALVDALNRILPKYKIDTYLRVCAFLGNCGIETDYFKTTVEYASGDAYDTRTSLGNTPQRDGDGRRYKGRGLTQTTGKYNYGELTRAVGREVGIDFVKNPERLAEVEIAVLSACVFWKDHNLNAYADRGEFRQLSGIVNRGDRNLTPLHWEKRKALYAFCKERVPKDISFAPAQGPIVTTVIGDSAYTTQINEPVPQPAQPEPVVLTPSEPAKDDSFLAAAFDKNVSSDEMKTVARNSAPRILARFSRPFVMLYAALGAGSVYAWLGVAVGVIAVAVLIYLHRKDFRKIWETVKTKFTA